MDQLLAIEGVLLVAMYGALGAGGATLVGVACLLACRGCLLRNEKVQFDTAEAYEPNPAPLAGQHPVEEQSAKTESQKQLAQLSRRLNHHVEGLNEGVKQVNAIMDEFEEFADSPETGGNRRTREMEADFCQIDTLRDTIESDRQLVGLRPSGARFRPLGRQASQE